VRSRNGACEGEGWLATRCDARGEHVLRLGERHQVHVPGRGTYSASAGPRREAAGCGGGNGNQPGHNPQHGKPHRCRMRRCYFRKLLGASNQNLQPVRYAATVTCHLTSLSLCLPLSFFTHAVACMHARLCTSWLATVKTVKLECVTFTVLRLPPGVTCGKKQ
jgi:hypothetical protein